MKTKAEVTRNEVLMLIDNGLAMMAMPMTRPEFVMLVPIMLPRARPGLRIREACIASVISGSEVPMAISRIPMMD